jgi:integrase
MAMLELLKGMTKTFTVHGMRSTFRNWCAECTGFTREVAEAALAHTNRDKAEAAYLHSDHFEKRIALMSRWAKHCTTAPPKGNVIA